MNDDDYCTRCGWLNRRPASDAQARETRDQALDQAIRAHGDREFEYVLQAAAAYEKYLNGAPKDAA